MRTVEQKAQFNAYMKEYHKQRMLVDKEYAERCKRNAAARLMKYKQENPNAAQEYWKTKKYKDGKNKYYQENKEKIKAYSDATKDRRNELRRNSYYIPIVKIKNNIRSLITTGIKNAGYTKKSKLTDILGCSFEIFIEYFKSKFEDGMDWNTIHCDHIIPVSIATNEMQVLLLSHYRNLRPCFIAENYSKHRKIDLELIDKHGLRGLYNILINAGDIKWTKTPSFRGKRHSEESKKKMSNSKKGRVAWNKGIPMTDEMKDVMRKANTGRVPANKGVPASRESVEKMRASKKALNLVGMKNPKSILRKIRNKETGEVIEGCLSELGRIYNFGSANMGKHGKAKNWVLLN